MISISVCMIVKNEEAILKRCLDSILPIADEIVIVDTGSTDNTKKIASEYTDLIYNFEWINDFSAARNFAFSKATKDYIYSADADEILDEDNLREFLLVKENMLPEIDIVQMKYVTMGEFNSVYNFKKEYRPKLFKRVRNFEWISPIHETIRLNPVVFDSDIEIMHYPAGAHSKRDFKTFRDNLDRGAYFEDYVVVMFCKELFISGDDEDFKECESYFTDILAREDRKDEVRKNIACVLARIYRINGNYNEFFKIALKDMAVNPCAEICYELGMYFENLEDYEEAIIWYTNAASETESIITIHSSGDWPLLGMSRCYKNLSEKIKSDNQELANIYMEQSIELKNQADAFELPEEL